MQSIKTKLVYFQKVRNSK